MSVNKVILIGRVGQDPETKDVNGNPLTKFSLATSKKYKDKSGEQNEITQWHNIVCWGSLANTCSQYVVKGMRVFIEGEIEYQSYEKDGEKKYFTQIKAQSVQFLSSKKDLIASESPAAIDSKVKESKPAKLNTQDEFPF